jgi:hypothetical protein
LIRDFDISKGTQIENYVNQLKSDKIKIGHTSYTIKGTDKQVWIITRTASIRSQSDDRIDTDDGISIKEIPYHKLIEVYYMRLKKEIGGDKLCAQLKQLA